MSALNVHSELIQPLGLSQKKFYWYRNSSWINMRNSRVDKADSIWGIRKVFNSTRFMLTATAMIKTQVNSFAFKTIEISMNFHRMLALFCAAFSVGRHSIETAAVEVTIVAKILLSNGPLLSLYISYHNISYHAITHILTCICIAHTHKSMDERMNERTNECAHDTPYQISITDWFVRTDRMDSHTVCENVKCTTHSEAFFLHILVLFSGSHSTIHFLVRLFHSDACEPNVWFRFRFRFRLHFFFVGHFGMLNTHSPFTVQTGSFVRSFVH